MSSPSGGPRLNETLRCALLRARLSEDDVAARLEVDPKTVRRWLEGRVPYMRHRWALAGVLGALVSGARGGVRVRICVRDPAASYVGESAARQCTSANLASRVRDALARYRPLRECGDVEIRLHREVLYNSIYRADDALLVSQHAYGIPAGQAPLIHLRRANDDDMVAAYLES